MSHPPPHRRRAPTLQITARDRLMLAFAAEQRFVLGSHVATVVGMTAAAASARLRRLSAAGYVEADQPLRSEPALYQVTAKGLRAIGSDLPRSGQVDLATYRHEAGVAWLNVGAQRGMFGPLSEIVSERRMRSSDRRADTAAPPFGVRLDGVGRDGRQRLHYPDLLVVTKTGHRVAFELELTTKAPRRREGILAAYGADRRIDAVVYLVDDPARRRALEESVRRVGIGDRVRVQDVRLGHDPHAPAEGRATQRAARRGRYAVTSRSDGVTGATVDGAER